MSVAEKRPVIKEYCEQLWKREQELNRQTADCERDRLVFAQRAVRLLETEQALRAEHARLRTASETFTGVRDLAQALDRLVQELQVFC